MSDPSTSASITRSCDPRAGDAHVAHGEVVEARLAEVDVREARLAQEEVVEVGLAQVDVLEARSLEVLVLELLGSHALRLSPDADSRCQGPSDAACGPRVVRWSVRTGSSGR